jgi:hypothetical protein
VARTSAIKLLLGDFADPLTVGSLSLAVGRAVGDEAECQAKQERPRGIRSSLFASISVILDSWKPEVIVRPFVKT